MSAADLPRSAGGNELRASTVSQIDETRHGLPPIMTVAETACFMRVSKSRLYESLRSDPRYRDLFFRWGTGYRIMRDRLLVFMEGGEHGA